MLKTFNFLSEMRKYGKCLHLALILSCHKGYYFSNFRSCVAVKYNKTIQSYYINFYSEGYARTSLVHIKKIHRNSYKFASSYAVLRGKLEVARLGILLGVKFNLVPRVSPLPAPWSEVVSSSLGNEKIKVCHVV